MSDCKCNCHINGSHNLGRKCDCSCHMLPQHLDEYLSQPSPTEKREDSKWEEELEQYFYESATDKDGNGEQFVISETRMYTIKSFVSDLLKAEEKRVRRETTEKFEALFNEILVSHVNFISNKEDYKKRLNELKEVEEETLGILCDWLDEIMKKHYCHCQYDKNGKRFGYCWNCYRAEQMETEHGRKLFTKLDILIPIQGAIMRARRNKKMTQKKLAELLGTKQQAISRLENGLELPSLDYLKKIAEALGLTINIRLEEQPPEDISLVSQHSATQDFEVDFRS